MKRRLLGKTGYRVSEVSLGTWQVGGRWGEAFDEKNAHEVINRAIDLGINFIDTADVYGEQLSERAIGKVLKTRKERVYVATKCGRRLKPHVSEGYNDRNIRKFVDESRKNMGMDTLDLIQLHCPPTEVYYRPEVFETLEALVREKKIRHYGVSVEKVEEALKAVEYPNLATVQIIFNMFRQRPAELFFRRAREKKVGIIVRVPLASGLLTGKFGWDTKFKKEDHRNFNREGKFFDKGETFSGVDFETGLKAVEELKAVFPDSGRLALFALKWVLAFPEVSVVIPGASSAEQVESNVQASALAGIKNARMRQVREIYERHFKNPVHHLW
jgi:aryl-alcohol dehydrogenase-like predicted oxidoreductase